MDSTEIIKLNNARPPGCQDLPQEKPSHAIELRVISGILVVALLLSIVANAAVGIHIKPGDRTEAAAENYLVDNTDYVQEGRLDRVQTKVQTLGTPRTLEDFYLLAGTQIAEGKYAEALDSIGVCLAFCDPQNQELYVDLLMKQGCLFVLLSQYNEALTALDQVITADPELADAYLVKAQIFAERQQNPQLAAALQAYLALNPADREIRNVLAQTCYLLEDYQTAAEQYAVVLDSAAPGEDLSDAAYLYGLTSLQLEHYEQAAASLAQARAANPELESIDYYLGVCQMSLEQYAEAVESFTASVDRNTMVQLSRYSRGVCRLMTDPIQLEGALDDLVFVAQDQSEGADPAVAQQALVLLQELAEAETNGDPS